MNEMNRISSANNIIDPPINSNKFQTIPPKQQIFNKKYSDKENERVNKNNDMINNKIKVDDVLKKQKKLIDESTQKKVLPTINNTNRS